MGRQAVLSTGLRGKRAKACSNVSPRAHNKGVVPLVLKGSTSQETERLSGREGSPGLPFILNTCHRKVSNEPLCPAKCTRHPEESHWAEAQCQSPSPADIIRPVSMGFPPPGFPAAHKPLGLSGNVVPALWGNFTKGSPTSKLL